MKLKRAVQIKTGRYKVGDVIQFKTRRRHLKVRAIAVKDEKDGMIFCMMDCTENCYQMNYACTNKGGYAKSDLRRDLMGVNIYGQLPKKIRKKMVKLENGDLLRLPMEQEIFGTVSFDAEDESPVRQWEPMKLCRNRIATITCENGEDEASAYWLQTRVGLSDSQSFGLVSYTGSKTCTKADDWWPVRLVFKLRMK